MTTDETPVVNIIHFVCGEPEAVCLDQCALFSETGHVGSYQ